MEEEDALPPELLVSLRRLSDVELAACVEELALRAHGATALLVAHLAELATRDVHLRAGYSSLFTYCRERLSMSEHDAFNHVEAARACRRFPAVLDRLARGGLNLTSLRLLAPHLTAENHERVLESARGKKRAEVEEIVASLAPFPEPPDFIRRLPPLRSGPLPLAPDRYRLQLTIDGATLEKLRLAKDMLRHAIPSGDDAAILDRAFSSLLADLARSKFAAAGRPQPARGTAPDSRHVPAEVKRAVWLRDLGRCAFVGTNGRRCDERAFVEFHHLRPFAAGGEATAANVQLRCRRHNQYEARTYFAAGRADGGFVREQPLRYAAAKVTPP